MTKRKKTDMKKNFTVVIYRTTLYSIVMIDTSYDGRLFD